MQKLVVALAGLTVVMLIIGAAAKTAAIGLGLIAATMAVLLIAAFLADKVSFGLQTLTQAMIEIGIGAVIFGAGAALIGVGCAAIAAAIYLVAKSFPVMIDGLIYLGQAVMEHGTELLVGFTTLLGVIALAIVAASPALGGAIVTLVTSVGASIVSSLPILSMQAFALIMGLLTFLYAIAGPVINSLLDIIVNAIHMLADGLRNHAAPIFSALGDLLDACFDMIVEAFASIVELIPIKGKDWAEGVRSAKDWVQPFAELGDDITDATEEGMSGTGDVMENAFASELSKIDLTDTATEIGEHTGGAFGESTSRSFSDYLSNAGLSEEVQNQVATAFADSQGASEEGGANMASSFLNSFGIPLTGEGGIKDRVMQTLGIANAAGEESAAEGGERTASAMLESIDKKVKEITPDLEGTFEDAVDTASDSGSAAATTGGKESGGNYVSGIDKGIRAGERTLYNSGWFAADTVDKGYRARSKTESPSKVAMQNGKFWDEGLALGVIGNSKIISDAGEKSADTLMNTMRGIIGTISNALNDDMDLNPIITPVLDLSNIQNGTNALNGMFGRRTLNLASANGIRFEANRLEALNKLETASTNADVVAALGLLRGDVNNLNESFANTQVVLDSGALVGATARQMDNALGRFKVYKGRGI